MCEEMINKVEKKITYKDVFSDFNFMKLLVAKMISRFGDSIDVVAYGWMVFKLTGSATLLAALYAVNGIPSFIFNMISGVLVTYWPKKRVVVLCDLGRGLTVFLTAFLFMTNQLEVWHLFVFTFINSSFEAFRAPASTPLFVSVVPQEKLDYAISASETGSTVAELIGYSVAGLLIATIGVGFVIALDAATFILSALIILFVKVPKETIEKVKLTHKKYFEDLSSGLKYVWKSKLILNICIFAGIFNLFIIPFNALQPAYVEEVLKKGPEAISVLSIAFLVAMMIGSALAPLIKKALSGKSMFVLSGILISIGYYMLSQLGLVNESKYIYVFLSLAAGVMGIAIPILNLPIKVGIMTKIEGDYLPRTVSFINALSLSTTPLGGGIVGAIIIFVALREVYIIFSMLIALLFILQIFNKSLKDL